MRWSFSSHLFDFGLHFGFQNCLKNGIPLGIFSICLPRWFQDAPRCIQEGPTSVPRAPQECQRGSQERPRASEKHPRSTRERPKCAQGTPRAPSEVLFCAFLRFSWFFCVFLHFHAHFCVSFFLFIFLAILRDFARFCAFWVVFI